MLGLGGNRSRYTGREYGGRVEEDGENAACFSYPRRTMIARVSWVWVMCSCGTGLFEPTEPPPEPRVLSPDSLHVPTETSTGVLNVVSTEGGIIYRDEDGCFVRRYGTANKDTPSERVSCPDPMLHPSWEACSIGQIFRDEAGSCTCHTMSAPNSEHARVLSEAPVTCPPPALIPDVIAVPEPGQLGRLNPVSARHGTVYRDRDGSCIVDGPLSPGFSRTSGTYILRMVVPCPEGMFEGCVRSVLDRVADDTCVCIDVEGDPPVEEAVPVSCPG